MYRQLRRWRYLTSPRRCPTSWLTNTWDATDRLLNATDTNETLKDRRYWLDWEFTKYTTKKSFLHPDGSEKPSSNFEEIVADVHHRIKDSEKACVLDILTTDASLDEPEYFDDEKSGKVMQKLPITPTSLIAVAISTAYYRLPKSCFDRQHTITHLHALTYWAQFGYSSTVDLEKLDFDIFIKRTYLPYVTYPCIHFIKLSLTFY